jgi:LuxR family maltose regulon positive regulatory protein
LRQIHIGMTMLGLLAIKLHRPSIPAKWVQRPYLIQRLNEGLAFNRPVTLVSAPAGFGKTTCISEWANALDGWPVTWLNLDSSDDDPGRFFAYLVAALQNVEASLGQEIGGVIRSGQIPPSEIISTTLVNDILALEGRFLLVLDDFHVIQDRLILQVMEQLLANFPHPLHLVLITREDPPLPLARLRANNQLTEIRARDLCFTSRDTDRFLNEVMGLSLSQADIATLEDKTEGWVVGLQLAGLSVRDRADPSSFIATMSGTHRFILSYLTEQVLGQQPGEIQHFLLQTSILDRLNGDLCNAVSGRSDSQALLEQLFNANLFLITLDDERQWYRYHHLFADLLRDLQKTFQEDKTSELHRRASRWYVQAGMSSEAIQHALAAEDYAMAVDLLESHAMEMIMQGYAKTVHGWIQSLPEEWGSQSPRTNLAFAWALLLRGAYSQASAYLEQLGATLINQPSGETNNSIRAEWLVMQSLNLYMQGKTTECMEMAMQVLELAPEQDSRVRSMAYYVQASVSNLIGDYPQAVEFYQKSIQLSRVTENYVAEMMSTVGLAGMVLEHGQLHLAFEIAYHAVERIERSGMLHPINAVIYASLGDVYYQWYQIEEARHNFQRALHLSTLGGSNTITILCHVLLSRLSQIEGKLETAVLEIQKAIDLIPLEVPEYVRQEVVSQQVRIYLALNRPAAAEMALQGQGFSIDDQLSLFDFSADRTAPASSREGVSSSIGRLNNSVLLLFFYHALAENDVTRVEAGVEFADHLLAGAFKCRQILIAIETLLLRAQMHAAQRDLIASTADYIKALGLAEPEGFISVFVAGGMPVAEALAHMVKQNRLGNISPEYVQRIMDAFARSSAPEYQQPSMDFPARDKPVAVIEPLTDRELDVLRLMADGLKYKEIAERLFVSLNTVRYHVKAIYGKLNVSNRTQAIELARQLRIL